MRAGSSGGGRVIQLVPGFCTKGRQTDPSHWDIRDVHGRGARARTHARKDIGSTSLEPLVWIKVSLAKGLSGINRPRNLITINTRQFPLKYPEQSLSTAESRWRSGAGAQENGSIYDRPATSWAPSLSSCHELRPPPPPPRLRPNTPSSVPPPRATPRERHPQVRPPAFPSEQHAQSSWAISNAESGKKKININNSTCCRPWYRRGFVRKADSTENAEAAHLRKWMIY